MEWPSEVRLASFGCVFMFMWMTRFTSIAYGLFIAPSKAWERGKSSGRMKPFERNPIGESPVRLEP
jgi:hypothetical protein